MKTRFSLLEYIAQHLSTGFGLGYIPKGSGTVASLVAILLHLSWNGNVWFTLSAVIITLLLGVPSSLSGIRIFNSKDPSQVVIDEFCGMFLALIFTGMDPIAIVFAFLIYRFLDIFKPRPIRYFESLPGGWGIMADDVVAGITASILCHLIMFLIGS